MPTHFSSQWGVLYRNLERCWTVTTQRWLKLRASWHQFEKRMWQMDIQNSDTESDSQSKIVRLSGAEV